MFQVGDIVRSGGGRYEVVELNGNGSVIAARSTRTDELFTNGSGWSNDILTLEHRPEKDPRVTDLIEQYHADTGER